MKVADLMQTDGRVFLKSEWAPISDDWPCVSFTKKSVGQRLRGEFRPGRDVLVYVGTTNGEFTEDPDHRGRLLSAVAVEPNQLLETRKLVPPAVWQEKLRRWGEDRWPHAMAVVRAANFSVRPLPAAKNLIPNAYSSFGDMANRGNLVEAVGAERSNVMDLEVYEVNIELCAEAAAFMGMAAAFTLDHDIRTELTRMATLIRDRVARGGEPVVAINPQRCAPHLSELFGVLAARWESQRSTCALCGGRLVAKTSNRLLQASADRIRSGDGSYAADNVQVVHLACNWAKNEYSSEEFAEWLDNARGEA